MIKNKYTQKIFIWVYLFEGWGNPGNTPAWQKSHNQTKKPNPNFSQYFTLRWIPGTSSATIKSIIQTKKLGISKGILLKADKTKIYLFLQSLYFLSVLSLILLIRCWDGMRLSCVKERGSRLSACTLYYINSLFAQCAATWNRSQKLHYQPGVVTVTLTVLMGPWGGEAGSSGSGVRGGGRPSGQRSREAARRRQNGHHGNTSGPGKSWQLVTK